MDTESSNLDIQVESIKLQDSSEVIDKEVERFLGNNCNHNTTMH